MLTGTLFLLLLVGTALLSIKMVQRAGIEILGVSASGFFIVFYAFIAHLPLFILFEHLDLYRVKQGIVDQNLIMWMAVYSCTAILLVSAGILVASRLPQLSISPGRKLTEIPLRGGCQFALFLATLACAIAIMRYSQQLTTIPIFLLFSDTDADIAVARSLAGTEFEGRRYLYEIFMRGLAPFVCYAAYATFRFQGGIFPKLIFFAALLVSLAGAIITTSKGQLAVILLGLILVHIQSGSGRVNIRAALIGGTIVLLPLLAMFYFVFYQDRPVAYAISAMLSRIFAEGAAAYYYLELFPQQIDYLRGTSFPNPAGVFPWDPFPLTTTVHNAVNPEMYALGVKGSMPSVFWSELYANWGYLGIVVFAPIIGFLIRFWDGVLVRFPRTPLTAALTAWVAIHFSRMVGRFFFTHHVFDVYLSVVLILFLVLTLINGNPLMAVRRNSIPGASSNGA